MLNKELLQPEVQDFIKANLKLDPSQLILKGSPFPKVNVKDLATQIQAKRKAEKKIPTWFNSRKILYPPKLNLSQSSSELTAKYKSTLVGGEILIDITGGFGIDDYYFSQKVQQVVHCELDSDLSVLAEHNFEVLSKSNNCKFINGNGIDFVKALPQRVSWIYADPGRRAKDGKKIVRLEEAEPNILDHLELLKSKAEKILLKTSPLLDLSLAKNQLKNVEEIHVISVGNEVKELLWIIGQDAVQNTLVKTINVQGEKQDEFSAYITEETSANPKYSPPLSYLFEPNAAILKAGLFKKIAETFDLFKIAQHTHLYTAEKPIIFPGRVFKIVGVLPVHKKRFKKTGIKKANISTRNFPMKQAQLKKKFGIKDGGDEYLFFTSDNEGEKLLIWGRKH